MYIELEEHYHTRLLAYVLDMFGLPFQVVPPPLVMRQFVKLNVFLPERLGFAFVGAAEMAGCIMFDELRRVGVELFADEPDVAARIERLYSEILTDEVGHVGYCAARCTAAERAVMRWLYPRFGRLFARQTAEISLLVDHKRTARPPRRAVRCRSAHRRLCRTRRFLQRIREGWLPREPTARTREPAFGQIGVQIRLFQNPHPFAVWFHITSAPGAHGGGGGCGGAHVGATPQGP